MFSESAELYDTIYRSFKDYAAEAAQIAALIRVARPDARTLLDVGCGTGEHVKHLRTLGLAADGLDLDEGLLAVARRKVPEAQFFQADMTDFDLPTQYDVVACLFSSIGYVRTLPRVTSALRAFRRHLTPGGVVIVEPWFTPGVLRAGPGATRHAVMDGEGLRVERRSHTAINGTLSTLTFEYEIDDASGVRTAQEVHELGIFSSAEMLDCFAEAGLAAAYDPTGIFDKRGLYVARLRDSAWCKGGEVAICTAAA